MRSQDEIVTYIKTADDFLGFKMEAVAPFLDYEHAQKAGFLREGVTKAEWDETQEPDTDDQVLETMRAYMEFAWGKVRDHRGISAGRSIEKMEAWLWLLGKDELREEFLAAEYPMYGAPQLEVICKAMDFPIPDGEDLANMRQGKPCEPGCVEGCG